MIFNFCQPCWLLASFSHISCRLRITSSQSAPFLLVASIHICSTAGNSHWSGDPTAQPVWLWLEQTAKRPIRKVKPCKVWSGDWKNIVHFVRIGFWMSSGHTRIPQHLNRFWGAALRSMWLPVLASAKACRTRWTSKSSNGDGASRYLALAIPSLPTELAG